LDVEAMRRAAPSLLGVHDFSALRAADCPAHTTVREIRKLEIRQSGRRVELVVEATAFLKHMVRNIVGTLVEIGHGRREAGSLTAKVDGSIWTQWPEASCPRNVAPEGSMRRIQSAASSTSR